MHLSHAKEDFLLIRSYHTDSGMLVDSKSILGIQENRRVNLHCNHWLAVYIVTGIGYQED